MDSVIRPLVRAVKITPVQPTRRVFHARFSTEAPPSGVQPGLSRGNNGPNHYHYYYASHRGLRHMWWLTIGAGLVGYWLGTSKTREKALRCERLERAYEDVKETKSDIKSRVEHAKERLHDEIEASAHDIKQKVDGVKDKLSNEAKKAQEDIKRLVDRIKHK